MLEIIVYLFGIIIVLFFVILIKLGLEINRKFKKFINELEIIKKIQVMTNNSLERAEAVMSTITQTVESLNVEQQVMIVDTQQMIKETKEIIDKIQEERTNYLILNSEEVATKIIDDLCSKTDILEQLSKLLNDIEQDVTITPVGEGILERLSKLSNDIN